MIVHQQSRRGQLLSATQLLPASSRPRQRATSRRTATTDDKGRDVMPYDLFIDANVDVGDLMIDAFGGALLRNALERGWI